MYLLRGIIPMDRNEYYIAQNTVKVTGNSKLAAQYLSYDAAFKAVSHLAESGKPFVVIVSIADHYREQDADKMQEQLYVLHTKTEEGSQYFSAATYDGVVLTDDIDEAAHYLSETAATDAAETLTGFNTTFDVEAHAFWSEV